MAKIMFSLKDPEDIPTLWDVHRQVSLAITEEIATSLKLELDFKGKDNGSSSYCVECLDSEVNKAIGAFIHGGVVPEMVLFTDPETTIDKAMSLATIGFDYSLASEASGEE